MSNIFPRTTAPEGWSFVAGIDESESYEVDISEIWRRPDGKWLLVTASGCSCWEGDYETQEFDDLDAIENAVLHREGYTYNPSLDGAKELVAAARAAA